MGKWLKFQPAFQAEPGGKAYQVKGGDAKEPLWVIDTHALQGLCRNGDGGVDWIGDDIQQRLGAGLPAGLNQPLHNAGVDLQPTQSKPSGAAE